MCGIAGCPFLMCLFRGLGCVFARYRYSLAATLAFSTVIQSNVRSGVEIAARERFLRPVARTCREPSAAVWTWLFPGQAALGEGGRLMKAGMLLATLLVTLVLVPSLATAQQTLVGALALNSSSTRYGWAINYDTASAARQRALNECGSGCRVVATFQGCGALAVESGREVRNAAGWSFNRTTRGQAESAAMQTCRNRGGRSCRIVVSQCNRSRGE